MYNVLKIQLVEKYQSKRDGSFEIRDSCIRDAYVWVWSFSQF